MSAPRVSDQRLDYHLDKGLNENNPESIRVKTSFLLALLQDLKDARVQLKAQQEMRTLYNKEPE